MSGGAGRVLLTGGTGLIGRHAPQRLLDAGFEVHTAGRRPTATRGVTHHRLDLLDTPAMERFVAELAPSHLLHLAWRDVASGATESLENLRWGEASLGLFRAFAQSGGTRAALAGSVFEYGDPGNIAVCDEARTPPRPATPYAAAKDGLRATVLAAGEAAGLSVVWPRIFFTYGPGERPERLVASIARRVLAGEPAPMSHGEQVRDYLYAPDVADAVVHLLASPAEGVVNVGSGEGVQLLDVAQRIARLAGDASLLRLGELPSPADEPPTLVAATERLRATGWAPPTSLDEGLARTVAWWREAAVPQPSL